MSVKARQGAGFDRAAAVTRSLLGWGVVVGPFYLVLGIVLALTRDGFEITRHPLSLLMLGDHGWIQALNLILSGLMTLAAALGIARALRSAGGKRAYWAGGLTGGYGVCLVASGLVPPDPMDGFPPGTPAGMATTMSASGAGHLLFGMVGFVLFAAAMFLVAGWWTRRGDRAWGVYSRVSGIVLVAGFFGGAFMPSVELGVLTFWIAVVVAWAWLALTSVRFYRTVPHPDGGGAA
ncbi:DUF998 domain-containing protein [Flindersiella endophytica]